MAQISAGQNIVLFSFYFIGLGGRKTTMTAWAERLAAMGWFTSVVTVQFSQFTVWDNAQHISARQAGAMSVIIIPETERALSGRCGGRWPSTATASTPAVCWIGAKRSIVY
ncbi:MAG: hypothetical protein KTR21_10085 [Rhodobacteraceae bacterium]|nr:hypothetical protein [Paracoccaceae bacterium]